MQEPKAPNRPERTPNKIWTVAAILYGTLLLLFVSMPSQVVSRLDDFQPTALVRGIQQGAMAVATVSGRLGIEPLYKALRNGFLNAAAVGGS